MTRDDLCFLPAAELARRIRDGALSAAEVVAAHLARIERVDGRLNAVVTLAAERALDEARRCDAERARGRLRGPLHGLPVGIKDLTPTRGLRTTLGSLVYRDWVPDADAPVVERIVVAGGIVLGKTNVPELGAGSQTFNAVFGATRNPYDPSRTCGGSTGGGAAALAAGLVALADGTDLGGSLRNPASFCNVVGLRPSPGRVPLWPSRLGWQTLSVAGPMGRTVGDVALLLDVLAGADARSPLSAEPPAGGFAATIDGDIDGLRVAWTPDLGRYPVERRVRDVCERAVGVFADLGARVDAAHPDVAGADEAFQTLRAFYFAAEHGPLLERHRALLKDTVVWNIEKGLALDARALARAEALRTAIADRFRVFFERFDLLALPVSQVAPFPVDEPWVRSIEGVPMRTYVDWMASCYVVSLTGLPALSVPAGFTPEGLPVGLQLVGRHRGEAALLRAARAFEAATGHGAVRPKGLDEAER